MKDRKRIAIIKLSHLGDIVHLLPVVRFLKKREPEIAIDWFVDRKFFPILEKEPVLDKIISLHLDLEKVKWKIFWDLWKLVRKEKYAAVFDFQGLFKSALLGWFMRKEKYYGFSNISKEPVSFFYSDKLSLEDKRTTDEHVIYSYLKLVALYLNEDFSKIKEEFLDVDFAPFIPEWVKERVEQKILEKNEYFHSRKNILLLPFSNWKSKTLPLNIIDRIVNELIFHGQYNVWIHAWGAEEVKKARIVASTHLSCYVLEDLPFLEAMAAIGMMDGVVGVDTGLLHVASQLKKKVIGIYGATNPRRNGPFFSLDHVFYTQLACSPCWKRDCFHQPPYQCMTGIQPQKIVECLKEMLG